MSVFSLWCGRRPLGEVRRWVRVFRVAFRIGGDPLPHERNQTTAETRAMPIKMGAAPMAMEASKKMEKTARFFLVHCGIEPSWFWFAPRRVLSATMWRRLE
jgi:hypothetical protein